MRDFTTQTMFSGHLSLELSESVSRDDFPIFAQKVIKSLDAKLAKKTESFDLQIWEIEVQNTQLMLVQDDFPVSTTLESSDPSGDAFLQDLATKLRSNPDLFEA